MFYTVVNEIFLSPTCSTNVYISEIPYNNQSTGMNLSGTVLCVCFLTFMPGLMMVKTFLLHTMLQNIHSKVSHMFTYTYGDLALIKQYRSIKHGKIHTF